VAIRARRPRLGQHFLHNPSFLARIAGHVQAAAAGSDLVVEIGPGSGTLTSRLLAAGLRVTAIEVDPRLAGELRERYAGDAHLEVVEADILQVDLRELIAARTKRPAVVAGNLPYYITSPILRRIFEAAEQVSEAILMVQKEVASRLVATAGQRDYGFLSILCQANSRPRVMLEIAPGAFSPPPKVFSTLVSLKMEARWREWGIVDPEPFLSFVQLAFHHKRKTLRNNLEHAFSRQRLAGIPESRLRGEQLSPDRLAGLWLRLLGDNRAG
jgi:16S rRNA (adenine1518-N6/adenine1519-N6)-dimethyltransferase